MTAKYLKTSSPRSQDTRSARKRQMDFEIIEKWIEPGSRVLDLGCGRGLLLEYLVRQRNIKPLGVDWDPRKISRVIHRNIPAYQGDIQACLEIFNPHAFDHIIISRTMEMLPQPGDTLRSATQVGRRVTVGFVNHGFWLNRIRYLTCGHRVLNEVYPHRWEESEPEVPLSIGQFEGFCKREGFEVHHRAFLAGDWQRPCRFLPNLRAGYAIYQISRADTISAVPPDLD